MTAQAVPDIGLVRSSGHRARGGASVALCALGLLVTGCGSATSTAHDGGGAHAAAAARLSIAPGAGIDRAPARGITVRATGGRITAVKVRTGGGEPVTGAVSADGTVWRSSWALNVSHRYTVTATAIGPSGTPVRRTSSFSTITPRSTVTTEIIEGDRQSYGVGMPIILYFSRPVADKRAVERALQIKSSRHVVGAWFWDDECRTAPQCVYFRPRHYWPPHTAVSFTGHLNGVEVAPGVYGTHTLRQSFSIGDRVTVTANTADHYMNVERDGRLFAHWPISTGRPGDETPDGSYLTIEKANPVDMVGPGYNIEVPWSVRFTWSGDYLHDAFWSVGEQGFTNVSHGCVNMSPRDAEVFYRMADPGDPVHVVGSPRAGTWDNGWTMWFLSWKQWVRGSALHKAVLAGPRGSSFIAAASSRSSSSRTAHPVSPAAPGAHAPSI